MCSRALMQVKLQDCRQRRAAASQLERREGSVAACIGVAMMYAAPALSLTTGYTSLLHALAYVGKPHCIENATLSEAPCS